MCCAAELNFVFISPYNRVKDLKFLWKGNFAYKWDMVMVVKIR